MDVTHIVVTGLSLLGLVFVGVSWLSVHRGGHVVEETLRRAGN